MPIGKYAFEKVREYTKTKNITYDDFRNNVINRYNIISFYYSLFNNEIRNALKDKRIQIVGNGKYIEHVRESNKTSFSLIPLNYEEKCFFYLNDNLYIGNIKIERGSMFNVIKEEQEYIYVITLYKSEIKLSTTKGNNKYKRIYRKHKYTPISDIF